MVMPRSMKQVPYLLVATNYVSFPPYFGHISITGKMVRGGYNHKAGAVSELIQGAH